MATQNAVTVMDYEDLTGFSYLEIIEFVKASKDLEIIAEGYASDTDLGDLLKIIPAKDISSIKFFPNYNRNPISFYCKVSFGRNPKSFYSKENFEGCLYTITIKTNWCLDDRTCASELFRFLLAPIYKRGLWQRAYLTDHGVKELLKQILPPLYQFSICISNPQTTVAVFIGAVENVNPNQITDAGIDTNFINNTLIPLLR
ncbi:MAG: hypothetical protein GY793_07590 [Proteobacteria bacterium]|nr:hypothetical protein [Pseudomonadota bacterium]